MLFLFLSQYICAGVIYFILCYWVNMYILWEINELSKNHMAQHYLIKTRGCLFHDHMGMAWSINTDQYSLYYACGSHCFSISRSSCFCCSTFSVLLLCATSSLCAAGVIIGVGGHQPYHGPGGLAVNQRPCDQGLHSQMH